MATVLALFIATDPPETTRPVMALVLLRLTTPPLTVAVPTLAGAATVVVPPLALRSVKAPAVALSTAVPETLRVGNRGAADANRAAAGNERAKSAAAKAKHAASQCRRADAAAAKAQRAAADRGHTDQGRGTAQTGAAPADRQDAVCHGQGGGIGR